MEEFIKIILFSGVFVGWVVAYFSGGAYLFQAWETDILGGKNKWHWKVYYTIVYFLFFIAMIVIVPVSASLLYTKYINEKREGLIKK